MSDPQRLRDRKGESGRELLRSAHADAPSEAARRRTAVALGLAVGTVAGTTVTVTAAATAPASKLGAYGGVLAFVKWIGMGAIGGAVAFVAVNQATKLSAHGDVAPTPAAASPADTAQAGASTGATVLPSDAVPPSRAEIVVSPGDVRPAAGAVANVVPHVASAPGAPIPGSLADEVRLLDRAEAALAAGEPMAARDALDAHDRDFKEGALGQEATVLRIETKQASGDTLGATVLAKSFLASFPDGAQAARVRSLLGAIEAGKKP